MSLLNVTASIYITEDFGASYFPDANGHFGMMSTAAPETHSKAEGDLERIQKYLLCHQTGYHKQHVLEHSEEITCPHHPQMTQEEGPLEMQFILWKMCKQKWLTGK